MAEARRHVRSVAAGSGPGVFAREAEAQGLADRLPDLLIEAARVSMTVAHGIHGRRRAGPGETFWQFRQYETSDTRQLIDWRRSASSDNLYVREREWEAAHTVWLWPDLSPSMDFRSHLSQVTKRDRGLVLAFALAELLVRGGERVGLLGLTTPIASRKATTRIAETLATHLAENAVHQSLPPAARVARFSGVVLFSDFLDPVDAIETRMAELAGNGVVGHVIQILDPAEETLPYAGRAEFLGLEGGERWIADRVESLRPRYQAKLASHRAALEAAARKLGWSFMVHHTDRPASEPLLALLAHLGGSGGSLRWKGSGAEIGGRSP